MKSLSEMYEGLTDDDKAKVYMVYEMILWARGYYHDMRAQHPRYRDDHSMLLVRLDGFAFAFLQCYKGLCVMCKLDPEADKDAAQFEVRKWSRYIHDHGWTTEIPRFIPTGEQIQLVNVADAIDPITHCHKRALEVREAISAKRKGDQK